MEKSKITGYQLFSMLILFQLGTAIVVGFGVDAKKDAWLAILIGMVLGMIFYLIYFQLFKLYSKVLTEYLQDILGKYLGGFLGVLYIVYFIYGGARDLRDVGDLLASSVYDQTPLFAINVLMMLAIAYVLYKGIIVLARISELYLLVIICLAIIGNVLILLSGLVEIENLLPILENGWGPIFSTVYPNTSIFPYGELICFTMILPYLNKKGSARNIGIFSILLCGMMLSYTTSINIAVLGISITEESTFPLYTTVSLVNIADFIQRLDAIVVLTLFIGAFFKTAIFFYAAVIAASDIFKVNYKSIVVPFGIIILFVSMFIARDFTEHLEEGALSLITIHAIFGLYIPLVLLLIAQFRKKGQLQTTD